MGAAGGSFYLRCLSSVLAAFYILFVPLVASAADQGRIARGKYLVTMGDCAVCHTAPQAGSAPFAGGYPLHAIFGTVYSTNITPDKETGIGKWTPDDFYRALHKGIAADGHHLYPAFPYPYFGRISRADSDAMFAYLRTVPSIHKPPRPNTLIFPANIRWLMTFWNWLFTPQSLFKPEPSKSAIWNRGGELVHGLAHCGGCHTSKNILFSDKPDKLLQGATIDGWHAPNLTGSLRTGLGKWSVVDIETYLKTGKNRFGWVVGNMSDVIKFSTSRWTDADRHAVAIYLKSLAAAPETEPAKPEAATMNAGQEIFATRCAFCHDSHNSDFPSLANNSVVDASTPATLVRVLLEGAEPPSLPGRPQDYSMPSFASLTDRQLADVATFIRNSWGNRAAPVSASDVKATRKWGMSGD